MGQEVRPQHGQRNSQPVQISQSGQGSISTKCTTEQQIKSPILQHWGDKMQPKDASTIWLLVQNIGSIDMMETGSIKLAALRNYTQEQQIDICTLTKCNTDWTKAPAQLHIVEQTRYWWESNQWSISHNTQETNEVPFQPGGMALAILNHLTHRTQ